MALEKLQREDNQTEAELRRAKVASFQLYAGEYVVFELFSMT